MSSHQTQQNSDSSTTSGWKVQASCGALNTSNPIREIIETMNLSENPNKKVIPLSIGDPTIFGNLKPCREILDALNKANSSGKYYGYQTASGMETAREAVAEYHIRSTGNRVKRQDVILASGCSHAIDLCICVLARNGQNILIPRPGFPLYKTLTSVYGVQYKQYNLIAEKNWSIDLKHLESLIDENTAAIVVNNPSNPCGSVFSRSHLLQILELAERYKKPIIADEIYDKFVFSSELYCRSLADLLNVPPPLSPPTTTTTNAAATASKSEVVVAATSLVKKKLLTSNGSEDDTSRQSSGRDSQEENYSDYEDLDQSADELSGSVMMDEDEDDDEGLVAGEEQSMMAKQHLDGSSITDLMSYVPFTPISSLSKTVPILTCGGISKTCLIPGLRLGWIIINDKQNIFDASVRNGLSRLTQRLMGPNSLVQGALHDILTTVPESFYTQTMDFIFRNALLCYQRLRLINGLHPHMPQGSMYLMCRFEAKSFPDIDGDLDFTSKLMNEESVLVLPGSCFDFPNYFRICLTVPTNVMEEALERIGEFCERHYISRKIQTNSTISNKYPSNLLACNMSNGHQNNVYTTAQTHNETPLLRLNLNSANNMIRKV